MFQKYGNTDQPENFPFLDIWEALVTVSKHESKSLDFRASFVYRTWKAILEPARGVR